MNLTNLNEAGARVVCRSGTAYTVSDLGVVTVTAEGDIRDFYAMGFLSTAAANVLASPPIVPTAAPGTNTTAAASTAFVTAAIAAIP